MSATCINPPQINAIPAFKLPGSAFKVAAGATVVVLIPWPTNFHPLSIITDGALQIDVCDDDITTIQNPTPQGVNQWNGGLWATNINSSIVNSANADLFVINFVVKAVRFVNSGSDRMVALRN